MWETIKHWWHDLWGPSHDSPPPAPAPAPAPLTDEQQAQQLRIMTLANCAGKVPLVGGDNPSLQAAQTEWGLCSAVMAQEEADKYKYVPPAPTPYGDGYN